jgi:general secretion pathway protein A
LSEASRASLMAAVREFLHSLVALQAFAVVIVDDAHAMSIELLEQLRLVSDLQDDLRLLQVVLVGEPSLSVLLRRPELRALADRVTVRERLAPLDAGEVAGYVAHRLQTAADRPRVIFDGSAIAALYAYSRGTPRIVNLVADRALSIGCERAVTTIDAAIVQQAAADRFIEAPPPARRPLGRFVAAALFALLVLAGAGTAAGVFRGPLARLVTQWVRPAAPQPPMVSPPARPPASP